MNYFDLLLAKQLGGGGGGSTTITPLSVTENGVYSAPTGTAYSPVTVSVSGGGADTLAERLNNTLSVYSSEDVTGVPAYVFSNAKVTEITLPNALNVGNYAFISCSLLQKVAMDKVMMLGQSAFCSCGLLSDVSFPVLTSIGNSCFAYGSSLSTINLPSLTSLAAGAFMRCSSLANVSVPRLKSVGNQAFLGCISLSTLTLPSASSLGSSAFAQCSNLASLYLQSTNVCAIGSTTFNSTPMVNSTYLGDFGSVFVPSSLLATYKSATNWASISARIVGV